MLSAFITLFLAGVLTLLLPCILPILPIILGASVTGRSKLRPLILIAGMVLGFVGSVFLLQVFLSQFVSLAEAIRIGTYQVLFLFGVGFAFHSRSWQLPLAVLSGLFFVGWGMVGVVIAALVGLALMLVGSRIATGLQQFGTTVQAGAREELGNDSLLAALILGLTMGLVWVPCAGPALGFALTLVRERPGIEALLLLTGYALGSALPLLLIAYGGQAAVGAVRKLTPQTGRIKQAAGILLLMSAIAFRTGLFMDLQTWLVQNTAFGVFGTKLEEKFVPEDLHEQFMHPSEETNGTQEIEETEETKESDEISSSNTMGYESKLSRYGRAPELTGGGDWLNSEPLTMASLKGKVVLIDFWTYSCINCIRTLPYVQGYWDKYRSSEFVLIGVHTPEFTFEKSKANVEAAMRKHGLTYPVVQDNDFAIWSAFANRYWPAKYLIDATGTIRYYHFGEGSYEETDEAIAELLKEAGNDMSGQKSAVSEQQRTNRNQSPEIYLGVRSYPALGNADGGPSAEPVQYVVPNATTLNKYYLVGTWQLVDDEYQVLRSDMGEIRMKWLGAEANLVLGTEGDTPVEADVFIDNAKVKTLTIDEHDLYNLYTGEYGEHELVLRFKGKGVEAFAFTFGS